MNKPFTLITQSIHIKGVLYDEAQNTYYVTPLCTITIREMTPE